MIDVPATENDVLIRIANNRWESSGDIAREIDSSFKKYKNIWKNNPEWLSNVPEKRSKVRDNRAFLAMESVINNLTGRPSRPNVLAGNETPEAKEIAEDLQEVFLEKYRTLNTKKTIKRGLRYLFFSKIMVVKMFWDKDIDDFNVKTVDPRKVRFGKTSTNEEESEFAIEEIDEPILSVISKFPEKEAEILKQEGIAKEDATVSNKNVTYKEIWIGNGVAWVFKNEVLSKILNPYYDFEGILLTPEEKASLNAENGQRRRDLVSKHRLEQGKRKAEAKEAGESGGEVTYENYLFNHFDKPRKPYIFGTVLEVEDKPIGETSLLEQVNPLQEGIDKRKRQIDDNADFMNGITKVDTELVNVSRADAQRIHYDTSGLVYGPGVSQGVTRETGKELPSLVFNDLEHSIAEVDNIFGTQPTFRGDGAQDETATGRAILREQSLSRLDELISLVDYITYEIYNWEFQMMKALYTETHLVKPIGQTKSDRVIEIIQDDLQDGIEVNIIPGQVLPEDRIFKAERAREDAKDGLIDPVTYLEAAGGYDNPEQVAKRLLMWKTNPFSLVELDDEDLKKLMEANEALSKIGQGVNAGEPDPKSIEVAKTRERIQQFLQSDKFKKLPENEQKIVIGRIREQFGSTLQTQNQ